MDRKPIKQGQKMTCYFLFSKNQFLKVRLKYRYFFSCHWWRFVRKSYECLFFLWIPLKINKKIFKKLNKAYLTDFWDLLTVFFLTAVSIEDLDWLFWFIMLNKFFGLFWMSTFCCCCAAGAFWTWIVFTFGLLNPFELEICKIKFNQFG